MLAQHGTSEMLDLSGFHLLSTSVVTFSRLVERWVTFAGLGGEFYIRSLVVCSEF